MKGTFMVKKQEPIENEEVARIAKAMREARDRDDRFAELAAQIRLMWIAAQDLGRSKPPQGTPLWLRAMSDTQVILLANQHLKDKARKSRCKNPKLFADPWFLNEITDREVLIANIRSPKWQTIARKWMESHDQNPKMTPIHPETTQSQLPEPEPWY